MNIFSLIFFWQIDFFVAVIVVRYFFWLKHTSTNENPIIYTGTALKYKKIKHWTHQATDPRASNKVFLEIETIATANEVIK